MLARAEPRIHLEIRVPLLDRRAGVSTSGSQTSAGSTNLNSRGRTPAICTVRPDSVIGRRGAPPDRRQSGAARAHG